MKLIYEGVDITNRVQIAGCVYRDCSNGRADSLDLILEHAEEWYHWGPEKDDRIMVISDSGASSGEMYLNAILPEEGRYRIIATAAKSDSRQKKYKSYENYTLTEIIRENGAECAMGYRVFGITGNPAYPYIIKNDESSAAFLSRIARLEGAALKTYNGRFTMIGLAEAQKREPIQSFSIQADTPGVDYKRKESGKWAALKIMTPYTTAEAIDRSALTGVVGYISNVPAKDYASAKRFARNLLMMRNRDAEELTIESIYNAAWTAMGRVDITGKTDAAGKWIIDECEHDLISKKSKAKMRRVIESVV